MEHGYGNQSNKAVPINNRFEVHLSIESSGWGGSNMYMVETYGGSKFLEWLTYAVLSVIYVLFLSVLAYNFDFTAVGLIVFIFIAMVAGVVFAVTKIVPEVKRGSIVKTNLNELRDIFPELVAHPDPHKVNLAVYDYVLSRYNHNSRAKARETLASYSAECRHRRQ